MVRKEKEKVFPFSGHHVPIIHESRRDGRFSDGVGVILIFYHFLNSFDGKLWNDNVYVCVYVGHCGENAPLIDMTTIKRGGHSSRMNEEK